MTKPDPVALHPMQRVIAAVVAEQRLMLEAFLDDYRNAVTRKVRGVSEEDVRRRLVPPRSPRWAGSSGIYGGSS